MNSNEKMTKYDTAKSIDKRKRLKILAKKNISLPEVPAIVIELNEILANPIASAYDIAQVVQKSPRLTAILLKIVNSPIYGF